MSGVLLYEMAIGKMPFRGQDENELLWNVCYEQIHYPMFLTKELTNLLQLVSFYFNFLLSGKVQKILPVAPPRGQNVN